MRNLCTLLILNVIISLLFIRCSWAVEIRQPNVVLLLADDMGYGEVQHLNPKRGKIATPYLDALAQSGMVFTDAHSGSAVCTPTRYGLMTGRYAWRTRLQKGVLTGGESLIDAKRLTLAKMLKSKGYHTAMVGKWHLGMLFDGEKNGSAKVSVGAKVTEGPIDRGGFDQFFGFHHARQMNLLIENDKVKEKIKPIEMLPRLTQHAVQYINSRKGKKEPFFLYIPWNSPHSPVVPSKEWQGKSGLNAHADFVMQTDNSCGQVIKALRRNGLLGNTIIISSSDNGTSASTSHAAELIRKGHYPSADLRGFKADAWDGGHRVPFIVSWSGVVKKGSTCHELVCLNDVIATMADILQYKVPTNAVEDSFSFYPLLKQKGKAERKNAIHHSISGHFAIRQGKWKLLLCPRSGGWTGQRPSKASWDKAVKQNLPLVQLYDMQADKGEQNNLAKGNSKKVAELRKLLESQVAAGRSNAGPHQENDVSVDIIKDPRNKKMRRKRKEARTISKSN